MTKQRPWPEAKLVIEDFVDRFVNKCVGRDIVENPLKVSAPTEEAGVVITTAMIKDIFYGNAGKSF